MLSRLLNDFHLGFCLFQTIIKEDRKYNVFLDLEAYFLFFGKISLFNRKTFWIPLKDTWKVLLTFSIWACLQSFLMKKYKHWLWSAKKFYFIFLFKNNCKFRTCTRALCNNFRFLCHILCSNLFFHCRISVYKCRKCSACSKCIFPIPEVCKVLILSYMYPYLEHNL